MPLEKIEESDKNAKGSVISKDIKENNKILRKILTNVAHSLKIDLKSNNKIVLMELIGKATINPLIFYTGKISGYLTWINSFLLLSGIELIDKKSFCYGNYISGFLLLIGLLFTVISLVNLGKSTHLGMTSDDTVLITNGIYKISRNPMYVGFNLITIASMIYTYNWIIIILGVYSLITYDLIIKGEENFLTKRFGQDYKSYQLKVRRYI